MGIVGETIGNTARCNSRARPNAAVAILPLVFMGSVASIAATPAMAADEPRYQFTPFYSYATGDDFEDSTGADREVDDSSGWGIAINFEEEASHYYEFIYARYDTDVKGGATPIDLDIQYLQIGGTVAWSEARHVIPYLGLTIGAARFNPDVDGGDNATKFAFSIGAGVRVPITSHFGVRAEWRSYGTVLGDDSDLFCESVNGIATCDLRSKSNVFFQHTAQLGVLFGF
jgi:opacity protein-like surface antigen